MTSLSKKKIRIRVSGWEVRFDHFSLALSKRAPPGCRQFRNITYIDELFKTNLAIFVLVTINHELLDDLSHFVPRERQAGLLEQLVQLVVTDEPIAVEVWGREEGRAEGFRIVCTWQNWPPREEQNVTPPCPRASRRATCTLGTWAHSRMATPKISRSTLFKGHL